MHRTPLLPPMTSLRKPFWLWWWNNREFDKLYKLFLFSLKNCILKLFQKQNFFVINFTKWITVEEIPVFSDVLIVINDLNSYAASLSEPFFFYEILLINNSARLLIKVDYLCGVSTNPISCNNYNNDSNFWQTTNNTLNNIINSNLRSSRTNMYYHTEFSVSIWQTKVYLHLKNSGPSLLY